MSEVGASRSGADASSYFTFEQSEGEAPGGGRFVELDTDVETMELLKGLTFRPVLGESLLVNFVHFEPHTEAPLHSHVEEQIAFVIDGEFEFEIAGEKRTLRRGMAAVIPPNVPHAARTYETSCLEVDVFHPPRRALLEAMGQASQARR
ncbi:MAG: cupin domain-containing protein [Actinobacteria bacterium]|nr:cupin domain-containing protein [Actinomycetota bacterium]